MHIIASTLIVGWTLFWLYWLIAAFGTKENDLSASLRTVGTKLRVVGLCVLIGLATDLAGKALAANHVLDYSVSLPLRVLGLLLFIAGLLFAVWARLELGKNWGMPMAKKENPNLITSGPYSIVRHPIYTGILLGILGTALSTTLYWLVVFVSCAGYFLYSAHVEEEVMAAKFKSTYKAYKQRTKMLIPFVL